ncbi:MAG TPA: hypothetical protein VG963_15815, partial [Polyangiaceae bacterium]|nr:hypothetical protein [Polyangiaceae bacterium]
FDEAQLGPDRARLFGWVERCARAVTEYYRRFPVAQVDVLIHAARGGGIHGGHTDADPEPIIEIEVGDHAGAEDFEQNWSLTHEMVHLALPNLRRSHHWLEEGLASYVEPIARARAHWIDPARVWREWIDNFGLGLPEPGDRGLDHTPSWGRTYWGGALFSFLADLEIRKRTGNRRQLADALRAVLAAGGNLTQTWPIERVLSIGDAATDTHVLEELYRENKDTPVHVDLPALWRELGVREQGRDIVYDDTAKLATIRRSFVAGG